MEQAVEKKTRTVWQLLRAKYPPEECVLIAEVSDTTGGRNRSADFIVVNLWPSRGNSIIGFEQKSFRNDWLNELKNPAKQEAIFKFCDYFYLVTDKENVAKLEEIPVNWGWMHSDGKRLKVLKGATKLEAAPCNRTFICSMLRRAASKEKYVHVDELEDQIAVRAESLLRQRLDLRDRDMRDYEALKKNVQDFKDASGIDLGSWQFRGKETGELVKFMQGKNFQDLPVRLKNLQDIVGRLQKNIDNELATFEKLNSEPNADECDASKAAQ